jgi:hypothetical protein
MAIRTASEEITAQRPRAATPSSRAITMLAAPEMPVLAMAPSAPTVASARSDRAATVAAGVAAVAPAEL